MIVYISLPISGKCEIKQRIIAKKYQRKFEKLGHTVINPFDLADHLKKYHLMIAGREPTYEEYMQEDLCNLDFCSHIFLLNGWSESNGCIRECERALDNDIQFLFESTFKFI